jgi:hypothetical protein
MLVDKVNALMVDLRTIKNSFKVAAKTKLTPLKRNETRWGSTYTMLERYVALYDLLPTMSLSHATLALVPTATEHADIKDLFTKLATVQTVSKLLQTEDPSLVSMPVVRKVFDRLIASFPSMSHHLAANATIIHSKDFESAVYKLQVGDERLSPAEKAAVSLFKLDNAAGANDDEAKEGEEKDDIINSILREVEEEQAKNKRIKATLYRSTAHVSPTSNIVERLFSRAKLIMREQRRHMDPSSLECLLMLRLNNDLWDAFTIQECITGREDAGIMDNFDL